MLYHIRPFKHEGQWVFTDIGVDLDKEPLVQGIDLMLDELTKDIPDADTGFELIFSDRPFEGATVTLNYVRADEVEGQWYHCPELGLDGWLCPNLKKYFAEPPPRLFMQAKFLRKPNVFSYPLSMREPRREVAAANNEDDASTGDPAVISDDLLAVLAGSLPLDEVRLRIRSNRLWSDMASWKQDCRPTAPKGLSMVLMDYLETNPSAIRCATGIGEDVWKQRLWQSTLLFSKIHQRFPNHVELSALDEVARNLLGGGHD